MYDRDWYRERKIDYDNGGLIPAGKSRSKFRWTVVGIIAAIVAVIYLLSSANF
jgi:hypothetical protein